SPLKFAFLFSISLAGAASIAVSAVGPFPRHRHGIKTSRTLSSSANPKATVSDLLAILGSPQQANSVNPKVAGELWSCFKFLAPHSRTADSGRSLRSVGLSSIQNKDNVDELIKSPPPSILDLARIAVDSGADPGAIHRALDPAIIPVPDVEGSVEDRCELTRTPYGRRFIDEGVNSYIRLLFETIVDRGPNVGLNVSLSRYDLFHGHLFLAKNTSRLGILFHAKEYPAYDKQAFSFNMGYCQMGSNVAFDDDDSMNLRNILWLAPLPSSDSSSTNSWLAPGVLVVLDANPDGIIYRDLVPEYVDYVRTLYEEDFGEVVVDVNYLNVGDGVPNFQIFIC
ncbi:hypothetical protein M569_12807, partial [Genlisea aurea]